MGENSIKAGQIYKNSVARLFVKSVNEKKNLVRAVSSQDGRTRQYFLDQFLNFWTLDSDAFFTRVIFKWHPDNKDMAMPEIAFLLDVKTNSGYIMSYARVGQHGNSTYGFYSECVPCKPEKYKYLKEELESLGYFVYIVRRLPRTHVREQVKALAKIR